LQLSINSSGFFPKPTYITHNSQQPTQIQVTKEHNNESRVVRTQSHPWNDAQPVPTLDPIHVPTLIYDKIWN